MRPRLNLGVTVLLAALLGGCATTPSCCEAPEAAGAFSGKSIYQVESTWTTDGSEKIPLGRLSGRPQVVVMFFAHCQYACPLLVQNVQSIEAALPEPLRSRVGFTLVSFDSQRDLPPALAQYRKVHNLAPVRWTLLHGEPDDVLELAALLGVKFKQDVRGDFAHSNIITVLNARGEIVHQQIGLNADSAETIRILKQLAAE